jgi:glutamate-ammonia-ligase adenylyltransferase
MAEDPPALRAVVLPFVYRRYLDYRVFDALRKLHRQIRNHTDQHGQAHPARANDVKLGRGGIREIEFTVQLLQVVRGGQYPELRHRGTLLALERLCAAGLIAAETADALAQAYVFLRQLEHRIQYLDDQQTHALPTAQADLLWCSETLGFACIALFLAQLAAHRACVAKEFDQLLGGQSQGLPEALEAPITTHGKQTQLAAFYQEPRVLALGDDSRQRVGVLLQRTMDWAQNDSALRETALPRFLDWLGPLLRRESYLALLQERPQVHRRLLRLLTAAAWPARYLQRHPGVIDELADARLLNAPFVPAELTATLDVRRRALAAHGEDDDDHLLNTLRRAHHAELFRILAQDVEGLLTVEQVADALSALADTLLRVTTDWCWARLCQAKSLNPELAPAFAIIAYGKLGGKELGYGSDLDLVFLYDDSEATDSAPPLYAALVRKLITWLSVKTGEGDLYEIDTALRPNGQSGLLVTSLAAYTHYQLGRGSNTAWTWEHQAMTRARCVLGPPTLIKAFDAVRHSVITAPRDTAALRQEVVAMRDKMRQAHPQRASPHFDVKHSPGGMVDVEFAVQLLVLAHSAQHPALSHNSGNIALLLAAEAAQLLPIGMGQSAAQAYRQLRLWQHRARLNEGNDPKAHLQSAEIATARSAVNALWAQLMGTKPIAPAAP